MKKNPADVGIIIGRFQVHELHEAHKGLIDAVSDNHDSVIMFIGLSPLRNTIRNPLDFNARKRMIQETYPNIDVFYIDDTRSDESWSANLDREITKWIKPHQTVMLYGGRDSFIDHYKGKYETTELESERFISGTEIRRRIANNFQASKEFRAGVIAASFNRFPTCYPTVDIAIIDREKQRILMGQKENDRVLRFIGGFANPDSPSYEVDARREVYEETGVEANNFKYIGSCIIDDWRYENEIDKIKTIFFAADYSWGRPEAKDDIMFCTWVSLDELLSGSIPIVKEHAPLLEMLKKYAPNLKGDSVTAEIGN